MYHFCQNSEALVDEDLNDDVACVRRIYLETAQLSGFETPKTLSSDKVSANTASWFSQCYEKSDRSQDARRRSPDLPNEPSDQ